MAKIVTFKGQAATDFIRAYRDAHYGETAQIIPGLKSTTVPSMTAELFAATAKTKKPSAYAMARDYILQAYPTVPRDVRKGMRVFSPYYQKHGRITHFKDQYVIVKLQDVSGACKFHPTDLEYLS